MGDSASEDPESLENNESGTEVTDSWLESRSIADKGLVRTVRGEDKSISSRQPSSSVPQE